MSKRISLSTGSQLIEAPCFINLQSADNRNVGDHSTVGAWGQGKSVEPTVPLCVYILAVRRGVDFSQHEPAPALEGSTR